MASQESEKKELLFEEYFFEEEPYYLPVGDEVEIFEVAWKARLPLLFKGPTGCGKTRFIEYMSWRLGRDAGKETGMPLITVACHEDLTASDLVGRYLLRGEEMVWVDGPLAIAVRKGALCYLDEIVEARKDTTVLIHPLADHRRMLPLERLGKVLEAHSDFLLVISYNPGYQSALKDLKHSTRQRFLAIDFDYPPPDREAEIIAHESGVAPDIAADLALLGSKVRNLVGHGLEEGASTRLLIYAGQLILEGIDPRRACEISVISPVSDDPSMHAAIRDIAHSIFPSAR